jgi:peptidyl-prolyl cis-trans isomerase B (cyclophilin B)
MIQTGDPTGTGTGGSNKNIKGEFAKNGVTNNLAHTRGVLSMARRGGNPDTEETMNSASSQFFIVQKDYPSLDGNYASFGKVFAGMDAVDSIAETSTDAYDKPYNEQKMLSIRFINIEK